MIFALLISLITTKNIYLIPHSHDDVGWLDTYQGIYEQGPGVRNIITSYYNALLKTQTRKFVQVETIYFKMWWEEQTIETKHKFKQLVKSGQIDFAAGGWSMNDEATSYYEDIIDVFTGGHTYLFEQLGVIPRVGWQIDPFGHSSTHAYISYMSGMDGQYFARIDQMDKAKRLKDLSLEFVWVPKPGVTLFCHINYNHYSSPSGFDFDPLRSAPPVIDSQITIRANQLLNYFTQEANYYKGESLVHTLGDDNEWSNAESYYENIEKLMNYINNQTTDKIYFTTPHSYLLQLNKQQLSYDVKTDDFFPYSDDLHSYWTGYYTSRVGFKGYARYISKEYQQMKTFFSKQISYGSIIDEKELLDILSQHGQHLGIAQHHDAITGTARQFVNDDYIRLLRETSNLVQQYMRKHLTILTQQRYSKKYEFYTYYQNSTSRECQELYSFLNDGKTVLMAVVMNSNQIITIPVPNLQFIVKNQNNLVEKSEVVCDVTCVLYLRVNPEQEIQYYKIIPTQQLPLNHRSINIKDDQLIILDNGPPFKLSYHYYNSSSDYYQPSGAYIFRPEGSLQQYGEIVSSSIFNGTLVTELIIRRTNTITKIRKYKHLDNEYQIETFVDSINMTQSMGKEIVLIIDTDIQNSDTFYTDSNGLDLQKRVKNYRETYSLINSEPVSQNYYPVTNIIKINSTNGQSVAVITDRAQGGTSLQEGQIELMIHRRIGTDDRRGVGEALKEDETDPTCHRTGNCNQLRGLTQTVIHHLVFFNSTNQNAARKVQLREDLVSLKYFAEDKDLELSTSTSINQSFLDEIIVDEMSITKIRIEPFSKYFLVRIHNLQEEGSITYEFPESIKVYETTMNGLLTIEQWKKTKLNWKTNLEVQDVDQQKVLPQFIKTFAIIR